MPHLLALDQGTTSSRAIVFDEAGLTVGLAQREFEQYFPASGWVEHDPEEIWKSQVEMGRQALAAAGVGAPDLTAIGIANQRETVVVWERSTGRPIYPAIVWQDRRTADRLAALIADGHQDEVTARTGLVLDPYFSATKIAWILDRVPRARRRAARGELAAGTIDTWLLFRLTGGRLHLTDLTNASRTLLLNLRTGDWDPELLELFGVPAEVLAEVRPSSGVLGETDRDIFGAAIPISGVVGDQQAALFGQQCTLPGMVKNTYGTGCFLLANTGLEPRPSTHRLLTTAAWQLGSDDPAYALEGSVFVAGAAIQWLRDGLGLIATAADINDLAASVPDAGGVCAVPAFTGLGAPHWDPNARGTLLGLTRGTSAGHLARAVLDGIAHQVVDVLEAMGDDAGASSSELRVDGGAAASDLLMQIQADLAGLPVLRPAITET
ncbi:glycerol kinase GlpK, partial [Candidatus Latescibacterota bacterium]